MAIGGTLLVNFVLAIIPETEVSCDGHLFSFHWFILDLMDMISSILILVSAYFILKQEKLVQVTSDAHRSFIMQTKLLSLFYIIFVTTDILFLCIADFGLPIEDNFKCAQTSILMAASNSGAYFLFFYGLFV